MNTKENKEVGIFMTEDISEIKSMLSSVITSNADIKEDIHDIKKDFSLEKEKSVIIRIQLGQLETKLEERTSTLTAAIERNFKQHDDFYDTQDDVKTFKGIGMAVKIFIPVYSGLLIWILSMLLSKG